MPEIKFCGLTRREDVEHAVTLGAEYVGVVLAPSRRQVSLRTARSLLASLGHATRRVGVMVDPTLEAMVRAAGTLGLAAVQVHGELPALAEDIRARTGAEVWGVVGVGLSGSVESVPILFGDHDVLLFDTRVGGATGGGGRPFDWRAARAAVDGYRAQARIALAGGLNADNVKEATGAMSPHIVDVSSGVEVSPGVKDWERMSRFAAAVRGSPAR